MTYYDDPVHFSESDGLYGVPLPDIMHQKLINHALSGQVDEALKTVSDAQLKAALYGFPHPSVLDSP